MTGAPDIADVLADCAPMLSRLVHGYVRERSAHDDLMQEIGIALWQALPRWRGDGSLRAFVARVAHNRVINVLARGRVAAEVLLDDALVDDGADPQRHAEQAQRRQGLVASVQRLPLSCRQVVILALEGFSQREIGQALGLEENTVAQRLSRARRQLRDWMGEPA